MLLYHASNMVIETPTITNRHDLLDFGVGFYTTPNEGQAQEFARKVFLRRGRKGEPTVNVYEFDEAAARQSIVFLEFAEPDSTWLEFVVHNRQKGRSSDPVDIIIGPVANDDVFRTVTLFETNEIDEETAIKRFRIKRLFEQVLFCNIKALEFLTYKSSYTLEEIQ
jgi:hypothetical protein